MFRRILTIASFITVAALATATHAADQSKYKMTATASRAPDGITIALKLELESTDAKGMRLTTTLSSPAIKIREGQEATIAINSPEAVPKDRGEATDDPTTGLKFSVFSIKGTDNVLVVGASLVKGSVVWDDAQRIPIRSKP